MEYRDREVRRGMTPRGNWRDNNKRKSIWDRNRNVAITKLSTIYFIRVYSIRMFDSKTFRRDIEKREEKKELDLHSRWKVESSKDDRARCIRIEATRNEGPIGKKKKKKSQNKSARQDPRPEKK